jgi:hypothetical protein
VPDKLRANSATKETRMTTKKTAAKTAKPAAKTTTTRAAAAKTTKAKTPPTHDEIADLARQYWIEGGHREGHADQDWARAVEKLTSK